MEPIRYVDELNRHYAAQGHPPYQWTVNESAPLTRLKKPRAQCTVTMLTSGGVSHCSMPGFDADARNDHRLDAVGREADSKDFEINDSYYNHDDANQDINCVFPIDRLRELQTDGLIGEIAPRFWSGFMGRIYDRTRLVNESIPAFIRELRQDEIDILVTAPA